MNAPPIFSGFRPSPPAPPPRSRWVTNWITRTADRLPHYPEDRCYVCIVRYHLVGLVRRCLDGVPK